MVRGSAGPRPGSRLGLGSIRDPGMVRVERAPPGITANLQLQISHTSALWHFCPVQSRARTGWRRIGEAKYVTCDIMATSTLHRQQQKTGSVSLTAVNSEL